MNTPAARELVARINGREVGLLSEQADVWSFRYSPSWIEAADSHDLSPTLSRAAGHIVDGSTHRPVQWFFDNLLPEEQARDTLSREANIPGADEFGLLAYYGRESAGALTLMAPGENPPPADYLPLTDQELHRRILERPTHSLMAGIPKKMSNAGAQDKLAVTLRDGKLYHPVGDAASTHLLKPDHVNREQYPYSVANEYFVMRLAAALELEVPRVDIRFVPDPVYLIERFDRKAGQGETRRLHAIDACQLLGLHRGFKYTQASVEVLTRCVEACENRARSRQSLMEWALFNLLVGNSDAHLKNISFHVAPEGIRIAPFYDLVSTESWNMAPGRPGAWPHAALSMPIGAAKTFAQVDARAFRQFAAELGVNPSAARRTLQKFTEWIEAAAEALIGEFGELAVPDRAARAGQLRQLRGIRALIKEMVGRMR